MHSTEGLKGQRQRPSIGVCAVSGAARGFRHGGQAQGFLKRFQVLRDPQHCLQGVCQHRSESIAQWSAASSWHLSCGSSPPCLGGGGRKCRLQFSLPHRYECVNCRIPRLGPRFAATSCRVSHAYPCLFPLDTDTGNCRKTCPTIMYPPPLLHLLSAAGVCVEPLKQAASSPLCRAGLGYKSDDQHVLRKFASATRPHIEA